MNMTDESYLKRYADVYTANTSKKRIFLNRVVLNVLSKHRYRGLMLDVGSGPSEMLDDFRKLGYSYLGLEPNAHMLRRAKTDNPEIDIFRGIGQDLPIPSNSIEVVLMNLLFHSL